MKLYIWCPGCDDLHGIEVDKSRPSYWDWDGNRVTAERDALQAKVDAVVKHCNVLIRLWNDRDSDSGLSQFRVEEAVDVLTILTAPVDLESGEMK
jgi:hypothetical protein